MSTNPRFTNGTWTQPVVTGLITLIASTGYAGTVTVRWDFSRDDVELAGTGAYVRPRLKDGITMQERPGIPALPSKCVHVLIPAGATVAEVRTTREEKLLATGVMVYPAQPGQRADGGPSPFVPPSEKAYLSEAITPEAIATLQGTSGLGGCTLAALRLSPIRYIPARLELHLATRIDVTLTYDEPPEPFSRGPGRASSREVVLDLVSNPQDIDRFAPADAGESLPGMEAPPAAPAGDNSAVYLLITNNALASAFQALVDRRTSQGKTGKLVTVESIQSTYPGVDLPEKIRNCVNEHYQNRGTTWVAIGGDETVVPPRYNDESIPVDLYYACLDGNWNADGDGAYGEAIVDDTDLYSEVWVGRIPVQTAGQTTSYVDKLIRFEDAAPDGFAGSMLIGSSFTWYMSGLARPIGFNDHDPVDEGEAPMRSLYRNVIQPYWQAAPLDELFSTYTTWDTQQCGDYGVTSEHVTDRLNWGYQYVYLWGYGNPWGGAGISTSMGESLTNSDRPSIMYVTSSSTAAYDLAEPCVSEAFLRNPSGGAVAYLGAARSSASTDYHATLFFKEAFQYQRATLGEAFAVAMMNEAPYRINQDNWRSWYLALCLHGDPALAFKGPESGRRVQVLSPHGCEVIDSTADLGIRWNANGSGFAPDEKVKLEYSSNGGGTWEPVPGAESRAYNSRLFLWESPPLATGSQYRVRVTSLSNPTVSDASDRDFTIGPTRTLTVQSSPMTNLSIVGTHANHTNYTYSVLVGSSVSLTAPPQDGYSFGRWADANGNTITHDLTLSFTCTGNKTVTAEYSQISQYRDYYVNDGIAEVHCAPGDDSNDGFSPSQPVRRIQQILDRYSDAATIHVSAGVYPENLQVNRDYPNLTLQGEGPDKTIIEGSLAGPCLSLVGSGSCSVRNLTLQNGWSDSGGGIRGQEYDVSVSNCTIAGNSAANWGGGIHVFSGSLSIKNSVIVGNWAADGGGVDLWGSTGTIANSLICDNQSSGSGGGVAARSESGVTLAGCTLGGNSSSQQGGGLTVVEDSVASVRNCILWTNHAPTGSQAFVGAGSSLSMGYCDVEGGPTQIGEEPQAILTWLAGNLATNPIFIDPDGPDDDTATWQNNDFHISVRSPCRDVGDPTFVPSPYENDIDGQRRVQNGRLDIGADETPQVGDFAGDGDVDTEDMAALEACATGPGIRYDPGQLLPRCPQKSDSDGFIPADLDEDGDVDQVDVSLVLALLTGSLLPPDLDRDFDVDQTDADLLLACLAGPGVPQAEPNCQSADFDRDSDVDQSDFGMLQRCLSGAGEAPEPQCLH